MKISIIIPVYNSEKYLQSCVDSLTSQTYKNIEIILIDDESTDFSPQLCDQLSSTDTRIITIHQKNGGTSNARNTGIKSATGEYLTFIDNDDFWNDVHCMETMVNQLNESHADALFFDSVSYWENKDKYIYSKHQCSRQEVVFQSPTKAINALVSKSLLHRAVWTKIVKRSLILENNLFFPEGMRNEDTDWTAKVLLCANSYDWCEQVFHIYRKGHDYAQTSKPLSLQSLNDLGNILLHHIKKGENIKDPVFKKVFLSYLVFPFSVWMGHAGNFNKKDLKVSFSQMKKNAYIIKYSIEPQTLLIKRCYTLLGFTLTCKILNIYLKNKH